MIKSLTKSPTTVCKTALFSFLAFNLAACDGIEVKSPISTGGQVEREHANNEAGDNLNQQMQALSDGGSEAVSHAVVELIAGFSKRHQTQSANGGQQLAPQNYDIDRTVNCPDGGTVAITAAGSAEISLAQTALSAAITVDEAEAIFDQCKITLPGDQQYTVDGTVKVAESFVELEATKSGQMIVIDGQGALSTKGKLEVTGPNMSSSCEFDLVAKADPVHAEISSAGGELEVKGQIKGDACGQKIDKAIDKVIQF